MILTADHKLSIVEIVGVEPSRLESQLTSLNSAGVLTTELQNRVITKLEEWETVGSDFLDIEPNLANKGARLDSQKARDAIKESIVRWLGLAGFVGSSSTIRLHRV